MIEKGCGSIKRPFVEKQIREENVEVYFRSLNDKNILFFHLSPFLKP